MIRKRTRSNEEDMYPQCKTHISEKEVNLGVGKDKNMKSIYAKTLEMLYKGSQKKENHDLLSNRARMENTACPQYKQMFLNNKCQLQIEGNIKSVSDRSCGMCVDVTCYNRECTFCEKKFCDHCIQTCKKCKHQFCSTCIFYVYEEDEEFSICRSCY